MNLSDRQHTNNLWQRTNVYEVNLRQYSLSGSFTDFEKHLPRLQKMGVEILWFMPLTPIGITGRKMKAEDLGSYYAVKDYLLVNEEFGTLDEWKILVKRMHSMGFKIIIDWVANHTAADHVWITNHPEYYLRDEHGIILSPNEDWTDTKQLNFENNEMKAAMIAAMKFWITETDIDGFRCDMAKLINPDFWKTAITELRKSKNILMIAEAEDPGYYEVGFDAMYTWSIFHSMHELYHQQISLQQFNDIADRNFRDFGIDGLRLFFTSNHDENSWTGTEFELFGEAAKCFSVLCFTMYQSLPLIYSGQEVPNLNRLKFFEKDVIQWHKFEMEEFYKTLLLLRKNTEALSADAALYKVTTTNNHNILCYSRLKNNSKVLVLLNLSDSWQSFVINDDNITGNAKNVFTKTHFYIQKGHQYHLSPWDFLVYKYAE
ncbi:alpha-amylase family glycosyl hydrolase [soil metagenome]